MIGPDTTEWLRNIRAKILAAKPVKATTPDVSASVAKELIIQEPVKVQGFKEEHKSKISLFKIAIVIIGIIFAIIYYEQSLNGRYHLIDKNEQIILDTRTGIIYFVEENKTLIILDQVNDTVRTIPLKRVR